MRAVSSLSKNCIETFEGIQPDVVTGVRVHVKVSAASPAPLNRVTAANNKLFKYPAILASGTDTQN
ncbi:hypothetical protein NBRC116598_32650 [Pseudophaeobacter arcticus]|jgi:hypothetical protein|uniref:Uncharacterized protein n=1 Tax=Pseudophaeobacter arcticus TaxID=385492 RepID=A0ABQ0APM5_9RHOB